MTRPILPEESGLAVDDIDDRVRKLERALAAALAGVASPGDVKAVAGAAPDGWLFADGSSYDPDVYPDLFAAIGNDYGGTLSVPLLPDCRGRVIIARDNMGGSSANRITASAADSLGGVGGTETHALSSAENGAHTHTGPSHTHSFSTTSGTGYASVGTGYASIGSDGAHTHSLTGTWAKITVGTGTRADGNTGSRITETSGPDTNSQGSHTHTDGGHSHSDAGHSHSVSGTTGSDGTAATGSAGSGTAHPNTQPWIAMNVVIKT